ncbi:MmcQ/YjbR family DNA-binding protein [Brevundimonas vesicularis]|uniref:MmcQ/YjbR family DNA-binding protein n=1 Tax=Brevundimonas vesicularis TaxID=41276 RepID=UPI0038D3CABA
MDRAGIGALCLSLPGAVLDYPFGPDAAVFKVGGKMFCMMGQRRGVSFKVSDMAYQILTENGLARPAPYLARAKWVNLPDPSAWSEADLAEHLTAAHALVANRLTRVQKAALGL